MANPRSNILRRLAGGFFAILAALWVFIEEWLWIHLQTFMAWVGKLPLIHAVERWISRLPPWAACIVFLVPAGVLLPFKLAAFWLIAHGHRLLGVQVFIVAKIVGTALLARIFALTKPALLSIGWFARIYHMVMAWKERLYAYVRAMPAYQRTRAWLHGVRARAKMWWYKHFQK